MWVQAATIMGTYQAVAGSAVASTPVTEPAPPILKADNQTNSASPADSTTETPLDQLIAQFLQARGITWDPADGTINGLPYSSYTNPLTTLYWVKNTVTLVQDLEQFAQLLATNPEAALCEPDAGQHHRVPRRASGGRRRDRGQFDDCCPSGRRCRSGGVGSQRGGADRPLALAAPRAAPASVPALPIAPVTASTPTVAAVAPSAPAPASATAPAASPATGTAPAATESAAHGCPRFGFPVRGCSRRWPAHRVRFRSQGQRRFKCAAESAGRVGRGCRSWSRSATYAEAAGSSRRIGTTMPTRQWITTSNRIGMHRRPTGWSRRRQRRITARDRWASPARCRRPVSRRPDWPRCPATISAAGRACRCCRTPGRRGDGQTHGGRRRQRGRSSLRCWPTVRRSGVICIRNPGVHYESEASDGYRVQRQDRTGYP